ncbi:MAG: hypothetical protein NW201_05750 [Gemmatimonadales bacterium]|nr:hypothetical protein [Gemmatimonadales bacterium]
MFLRNLGLPTLLVAGVALGATACSGGLDQATAPAGGAPEASSPRGQAARFRAGLEVGTAPVGAIVPVHLVLEGDVPAKLNGIQGYVRFDARTLEFVGVDDDRGTLVIANDRVPGEVRFVALKLPKLDAHAAVLAFRVKADGYARGVRFDLEEAATADDQVFGSAATFVREAALAAVEPATPSKAEWEQKLIGLGYKADGQGGARALAFSGDGFVYGDVNLSNSISVADVVPVANTSVGLGNVPDSTANRDVVLAGNVRPVNGADGTTVGFNDPCPPGVECTSVAPFRETGKGSITVADLSQIAIEAAGGDASVVGEAIAKVRTFNDTTVIAAGTYTAATCPLSCDWNRSTGGRLIILDGIVRIAGGAVLNIRPGVRIEGRSPSVGATTRTSALFIDRDAQIFAQGDYTAPIVMSCTAPAAGDPAPNGVGQRYKGCWGGLAIVGSAPINYGGVGLAAAPDIAGRNPGGGGLQRLLEGTGGTPVGGGAFIDTLLFGGNNADDNSGTLRYLRIEYAGRVLTALGSNNELNGITLGGVGRGTTIEYIQIHAGLDDGYELFGGNVNARYLYLTANSDDDFDWSFGWTGSTQFVIVQKDSLDGDKGFEGDNSEGSGTATPGGAALTNDFNVTPRTNGPLYNFTMIGKPNPSVSEGAAPANSVNDLAHIRRGNRSQIANVIAIGWRTMADFDDAATCANTADDPEFRNSAFGGWGTAANLGNSDGSDPVCFRGSTEGALLTNAAVANDTAFTLATYRNQLRKPFDKLAPDFRPIASGNTAADSVLIKKAPAAPPSGNTFITPTTFVGAVAPAGNPANNLAWYMGWTRGWTTATQP